jgi:hypothetical protein
VLSSFSIRKIVLALAPGGAEVGTLFTPGRPSQVFPSQSSAKDELAPTSDIQVGAHQPDGGVANGALNPVKGSKRSGDAPQLPLKADKGHAGTGGAGLGRGGRKGAVWIYGNSEEVRKARIGGFGPLQVLLKNFRLPPPPPSRGCEYLSVLKTPRHVKNRLPLLSPRSNPRADDGGKGRDGKNEGEAAKDQAGLKCLVLDWEHKVFERKVCDEGAGRSGQDGLGIASPRLTPTALTSSLLAHNNFATCAADKEDVAPWGTRLDVDDDRGHLSYESTLDMLEVRLQDLSRAPNSHRRGCPSRDTSTRPLPPTPLGAFLESICVCALAASESVAQSRRPFDGEGRINISLCSGF